MKITFAIPSKPVSKARAKPIWDEEKRKMHRYIPKPTTDYQNFVKQIAEQHFDKPTDKPVILVIKFKLPRPKNMIWKTKPMPEVPHTKMPDLSNFVKAVEDGLEGIAYYNDSQIYKEHIEKVVHAGDDKPEAIVTVEWEDK